MSSTKDSTTEKAIGIFERTSGLNRNQAKTIFYWTMATWGLPDFDKFPILVINGPFNTGKTTTLRFAAEFCRGFDGILRSGEESMPAIRDNFVHQGTTAIDEADGMDEALLISRHARETSERSIKQKSLERGWDDRIVQMFGATIIHRRKPFVDQSVRSRSIVITTVQNDRYGPVYTSEVENIKDELSDLAKEIVWQEIPTGISRTREIWQPLFMTARHFGDEDWILWAELEIESELSINKLGQQFEISHAAFGALLELSSDDDSIAERVKLSELRLLLNTDGSDLTSQQISAECKSLGFEIRTAGGQKYVYTGGLSLMLKVSKELGIVDSWLEERR